MFFELLTLIGLECCSRKCLSNITFNEASVILDEWNLTKTNRLIKLKEYLTSRKTDSNVLYTHKIGENWYLLEYTINQKIFYLCPKALTRLTNIGIIHLTQ